MVQRIPITEEEGELLLYSMDWYRQKRQPMHLFSTYMNTKHMTKVLPLPDDPSLVLYHINYVYDEHALVFGQPVMRWLNRAPWGNIRVYHNPHVSTWYFQTVAPRQLSVEDTALILSLAIVTNPASCRLLTCGEDIPPLPDPPDFAHLVLPTVEAEAQRRRDVSMQIQPPHLDGRILTFWTWHPIMGEVYRFRVLIDEQHRRLIVARHWKEGCVGDHFRRL